MEIVSFQHILTDYKAIFLDSYGVIKNHKGLIPGVGHTLEKIRSHGITLRVLTNDASRSQEQLAESFNKLGLRDIHPHEIISSGMMAQQFLEKKIPRGRVAFLGTPNSAHYIHQSGLESISISEVDLDHIQDLTAVAFLDDEGFDWNHDINKVLNLLRRKSIPAIVANSDMQYPVSRLDVSIATGGIANLVEQTLDRKFVHFGKPDSQMFMYAFEQINKIREVAKEDILMVGDTLETDILGGNKFGIKTLLVLSGNTRERDYERRITSTGIIPDFVTESIAT